MQRSSRPPHRSRASQKLHNAVNVESLEPRRMLSATAPINGALIDTSVGGMFVQLRSDLAPNTVNNFLGYANSGAYDGTIIHRVTTVATDGLAVIQGGGFKVGTDSTGAQSLRPLGSFLGSTNDTLTFTAGISADTITRSEGSFIADAFAPGQTLTITSTTSNNITIHIASLTATVITLSDAPGTLTNESITDSTDVGITTTLPTIPDENPNTPNTLGTIAMAKTTAPDSASTEWFINTADNSNVLSTATQTNGGFTVFGNVIYGLNVAIAIDNLRAFDASSTLGGAATELPVTDRNQFVDILSVTQEQFMTVTIGAGQPENSVLFTDADGTRTTLVITHGTATITLTGTGLSSSSAGGVVSLGGTVNELEDIVTSGTSLATTLTASAAGGNLHTTAHNLTTTGAIGSIQLNAIDLLGTYTTVGPVSWTGPSNDQTNANAVVPATLTVSGAKTLAYQFDVAANITQKSGHSFIKGSNTDGSNPLAVESFFNIDATGTTTASILKVTTPRGKFVNIGGFSTNGSMNGVDARHTINLTGPLVVAGTMRRVNLIGMSDANIVVQGTTKGKTLIVDSPDNFDSNVFSSIPIKSILVAGSWISTSSTTPGGNTSTINAPSLGNMIVLGTFGVDLTLTDAKSNIKSIQAGMLAASTWTIAGGIGKWTVGTVNSAFHATISGSVQSIHAGTIQAGDTQDTETDITVSGNVNDILVNESQTGFSGTVTGNVQSIKTVTFAGSWSVGTVKTAEFKTVNAGFLVANAPLDPKKLAIGSVLVLSTADNFFIQTTNGNIGSISANSFTDRSRIMAGILDVGSNLNTLVATPDKYQTHATVGSVSVHRSSSPSFVNTLIDAWHIGKLNLGTITLENVGVPFGLAADSIDFISARGNNGQNLSFTHKIDDPAALQQEILQRGLSTVDFQIVLV